jgi:tetratricopeptide (TPR) repeat protein
MRRPAAVAFLAVPFAVAVLVVLAAGALARAAAVRSTPEPEALWHHRNLGKAFYENPTTQAQAVEELKKALDLAPGSASERLNYGLALLRAGRVDDGIAQLLEVQRQDPAIPHTWFNLGMAWKRASDYDRARAQLERMVALVPDEPISHYNLGVLWAGSARPDLALAEFEKAAALAPGLAGPHFQLYNAYKNAGRAAEAARELATFQEIKKRQAGAAVPEDLEWSYYAELYDPAEARGGETLPAAVPPRLAARGLAGKAHFDPATAGLVVLDADGDGRPDLLAWSAKGVVLYKDGTKPVAASGLEGLTGVVAVAPGDFDNDGLPDLCVLVAAPSPSPRLFHNVKGRFVALPLQLPAGRFRTAVWLDYDHDYDVDLFLLGDGAALLRNNGDGTWSDETARFPFVPGRALSAAALDVVADAPGVDLAVTYADRPGVIYRDRLAGRYEAEPVAALPAGARDLAAGDFDGDGWTDLVALDSDRDSDRASDRAPDRATAGPLLLANRTGREGKGEGNARSGSWARLPAPASAMGPFLFADLENRGASDLVAGGGAGFSGYLAMRPGAFAEQGAPLGPSRGIAALAAADFDGDGRIDLAAVGADGSLTLLANRTADANRWLRVSLQGIKNLKLAPEARVEVKAGDSYQKRLYQGVPLAFGLGGHAAADTVRITWPNGLIQNEPRQAVGEGRTYKEAQRLSGSCPMIFTWDGERFRFITDVLGVAPLGASSGNGEYFPVDHDEYVQIPGEALRAVDGRYEVRITEELREVSYLDQVRLIAVDHPRPVEVFTNDKFKGPPFPEFRLFGARRRIYPVAARDDAGRDVLPRLLHRDGTYPDGFRRDFTGIAEPHTLDLDFGSPERAAPGGRAVLVLTGWVDWADGSTFLAAAQATAGGHAGGLLMPQLQVKDAAGRWRTVIEDMGIPSGKPKTIAVDLTGKFLSASRQVRIVTSVCVYWDEIFLTNDTAAPETRLTPLDPASADLHFRGFSTPVIHPERKQPEAFDYARPMPLSMWNPTPGLYTRYGDVRELLGALDDRLLIMGSGDEVRLLFDAAALPPLRPGWQRDFLLLVDGWAKDADANTAFSQSVEPLPFHAMSRYPYPAAEHFPDDPAHRAYRATYDTRPALRLLRPLREAGEAAARP